MIIENPLFISGLDALVNKYKTSCTDAAQEPFLLRGVVRRCRGPRHMSE